MTSPKAPQNPSLPSPRSAQPAGQELQHEALRRLLGGGAPVPEGAVERFLRQAPALGIDLDLLAVVLGTDPEAAQIVRQVCLPIIGAGRTIMLFLSPGDAKDTPAAEPKQDRALAIHQALELAVAKHGEGKEGGVHLVQGLLEPRDTWAAEAYETAGLTRLTELLYLSRRMRLGEARAEICQPGRVAPPEGGAWPEGLTVRPMEPGPADEPRLHAALTASYEQTLDCPELAGLRPIEDIVAAHRGVGEYDPGLWWLLERAGEPEGCVLLNRCADQGCVELVYIGLSPAVRGLGLGHRLMQSAIGATAGLEREMRCAVDVRNHPARRMYAELGFTEAGWRVAFVGLVKALMARNPSAS